jgi:hypothetical protein
MKLFIILRRFYRLRLKGFQVDQIVAYIYKKATMEPSPAPRHPEGGPSSAGSRHPEARGSEVPGFEELWR